jgi:hypothetical protein
VITVDVQIANLRASAERLRAVAEVWEATGSTLAADIARREATLDEAAVLRLQGSTEATELGRRERGNYHLSGGTDGSVRAETACPGAPSATFAGGRGA